METENKYKRLAKDTFIFAVGNFGSKLILFFMVPLYTNYLSAAEYGTADLVFTISQFLIPIFSLVIFDAVIRFGLSKHESAEEVLLNGLLIWLAGTAAMAVLTPFFGMFHSISEWKWYLFAYSSLSILYPVLMNYLKTIGKNKTYAVVSIVQTLLYAVFNVLFLVVFQVGIKGYLLSNILAIFASCIMIMLVANLPTRLLHTSLNVPLLREMTSFSTPLILNNISWWVIHSSDKIMIEWMIGATALGIYTVATKIPSVINMLISIFSQAWGISSVREMERTNDTAFYSDVFRIYSFLAFLVCILLSSMIKPFMQIYVGQEFRNAWHYVPLLLVSAVFSAISAFYGSIFGALKQSTKNMLTTLTGAVANIIVNYLLIQYIGIWGAAIGTAMAYIIIAYSRILSLQKLIHIDVSYKKLLLNSLIVIVHAAFVSLDCLIAAASAMAMVCFLILNGAELKIVLKIFTKRRYNK